MNLKYILILALVVVGIFILKRNGNNQIANPDEWVIEQLKGAGSNVNKPHNIEFFLYFPTIESAKLVEERLNQEGFVAKAQAAAEGNEFVVLANMSLIPNLEKLTTIREKLNSISSEHNGLYDGWGAPIVDDNT